MLAFAISPWSLTHTRPYCVAAVTGALGLVDRDFDEIPSKGNVEVLPVHEAENLLLDFDALASLSKNTSAAEVRDEALAHARTLEWWAASAAALRTLRFHLIGRFPEAPIQPPALAGIKSRDRAIALVTSLLPDRRSALEEWTDRKLHDLIDGLHGRFAAALASDEWITTFPGKELLRNLRSRVFGLDVSTSARPSERDLDLAKRAADAIAKTARIPGSLLTLLTRARSAPAAPAAPAQIP